MNRKNIGKNLKTLRRQRELTQAELAKLVNVSTDHISHAEIGFGTISLSLMMRICSALDVTPDDILAGEFETDEDTSLQNAVIPLGELSPQNRILILDLFMAMKGDY